METKTQELIIDRKQLNQALGITNLAVSSKPALPILENLLFEINEKNLTITATDLEIFIKHRIAVNSEAKMKLTAPAKRLKDIVASLPDTEAAFSFNSEKNKLNISADKTRFCINTIPADDFPKIEIADKEKTITMQQSILKDCLGKTIFAVSEDEARHAISGLCFDIKNKRLTLIGTDGRRLAVVSHDINSEITDSKYILPAKAIKQLLHILQSEGEVKIYLDKTLAGFEINNTILGVRLIEGDFPEYQQIIPKEAKLEFNLEAEKLINATKRAALLTKEGSGVKYSFGSSKLILSSNTPEIGEAKETLEIESPEQIDIVFNPQYVLEALQGITTERVILGLNNNCSPARLEALNDGNYLQLIMPLRME